jgi:tetratricopeptide (TPR) repeat protein
MPSAQLSTERAPAPERDQTKNKGNSSIMTPADLPTDSLGSGALTSGDGGTAASQQATPVEPQQNSEHQLRLVVLLLERGRHREALAALQPLLAQQPGSAELLCLQGRCLAALGSRPQALAAFAAALMEAPGCVAALVGCAAVYKESGLLLEALSALEKALALLEAAAGPAAGRGAVAGQAAAGELPHTAADVRLALAVVLTDLGECGAVAAALASHTCGGLPGRRRRPRAGPPWPAMPSMP